MPHIAILDQSTINKIAAGEVIERPASVVKELLENAIDAQATAVTVEIRDGGISFIRVTDNGCGIPKDEVGLAFLRHSTSKIKSVEDLFTVASLGFRGEALSSIAAVSQVELITKTPEQLSGARYQIDGGKERSMEEIGAPEGTTFLVRNLFYNTPARQKFLKTAQTEGAHVAALVEKIAMSRPDISIRFIQNNQNKLHTSGNHNLKDIIYTVFGREIAANLLPVTCEDEILQARGFAGKPVIARSNRNFENYYINGRYVKSSLVAKAIEEAYKPYMMQHKYPFVLLHLTIEPEYLDVNVHPTKMELRFRDGERIYELILSSIRHALEEKELIPQISLNSGKGQNKEREKEERLPRPEPFEVKRQKSYEINPIYGTIAERQPEWDGGNAEGAKCPETRSKVNPESGPETGRRADSESRPETGKRANPEGRPEIGRKANPASRQEPVSFCGQTWQALDTVSRPLASGADKAASASGTDKAAPASAADKPTPVFSGGSRKDADSPRQLDLFEEKLLSPESRYKHKLIGQLFDTYWLVEFRDQLYIIDQHAAHEKILYEKTMNTLKNREYTSQMVNPPIILTLGSEEQVILNKYMNYFTEIGFEIEHFGGKEYAVRGVPDNLFSIAKKELLIEMLDSLSEDMFRGNPDMIYEKVASMSCKAAVKGNNRLSPMEADRLIDQLLKLENPYACPHGRPTIVSMSKHELEKKFKRIL
ncbi:MAG: DNA mismatch repair endonuclease MutL [Hungatella sp.]|nr:DNA mismatch repair endonuclease MutL [Hungatella sp.]